MTRADEVAPGKGEELRSGEGTLCFPIEKWWKGGVGDDLKLY